MQGVGFRPFIYNLAVSNKLTGFVSNTSQGVIIEVEGAINQVDDFINNIKQKAPPISLITNISSKEIKPIKSEKFIIKDSSADTSITTLISPDIAVCKDCLQELFDFNDRRYHYPFINCTNCGPRYTIIDNIPYDRPYTSMKNFTMCQDCQAEYDDSTNRRFHAQPNACQKCGPQVQLFDSSHNLQDFEDPIAATLEKLMEGKIVAIKGLGGFHLAVDATNNNMVQMLRKLKGRDEKPFALMVRDINTARQYCLISNEEKNILQSYKAPILLLKKLLNCDIADSVAPGNEYLGIMLPYTPLHHILFEKLDTPLIMTSANYSEEPICINNDEAFERLNSIADYFLIHDRDIYFRSDDSVTIHLANKLRYLRRSRGIVPQPIFVKSTGSPILAVGGELKNTVCLLKDDKAIVSQHIGDLENIEAYNFFKLTIEHLQRIFDSKPEMIVHDMHPQYFSTLWASEQSEIQTIASSTSSCTSCSLHGREPTNGTGNRNYNGRDRLWY